MDDANLVGGSPEDRRRLLARMGEYLDANARFDWEKLQEIWSPAGEAVFFNLNGHTYRGRAHWTRLWRYYKENVASGYWTPFDIGGVVSDALAVIWCERQTHSDWVGTDPMPTRPYGKDFVSRSTMVFRKEGDDWRVVHVHFSPASEGPRPGGITVEELGTVKWYNATKGFGFIGADQGGKDIFVHASVLERAGIPGLAEGQRVAVDVAHRSKGPEAAGLRLV